MSSEPIKVEIKEGSPEAAAEAAVSQLGAALQQHADSTSAIDRRMKQLESENRALLESNVRQQEEIERLETEVRNLSSRNSNNSLDSLAEEDDRKAELLAQISNLEGDLEALETEIANLKDENQNLKKAQPSFRRIPEYPCAEDFENIEETLDWAEQEIIRLDDEAARREARLKAQLTRVQAKLQNSGSGDMSSALLRKQLHEANSKNVTLEATVQTLNEEKAKLVKLLEAIKKTISARSGTATQQPRDTRTNEGKQETKIHNNAPSVTPDYSNPLKSIQQFATTNQ